MNYVYTAIACLLAGALFSFFLYHKEIQLGQELLARFEDDREKAWRWLSSLPAKIKDVL